MDLTIKKSDLSVLSKLQGLAGRKTSIPVTSCVLLVASNREIFIRATDLETGFEGVRPATVQSGGAICVNAKTLHEIVMGFPSEDIHIKTKENFWTEIKAGNIIYNLSGMNPEDFPALPDISNASYFNMDSATLKRMIEKMTVIGGSFDDNRPHINGVLFVSGGGTMRMVSTDGSRLSKFEIPSPTELSKVIIPKKGLADANKFLGAGEVQLGVKGNYLIIKKDTETVLIRLLEGDFPDYERILSGKPQTNIVENPAFLSAVLKRMSILCSENYSGVILYFHKGKLTITSENLELGDSKEAMKIDYAGEPFSVALNPKYLLDAIGSVDDEAIVLSFTDGESPFFVEGTENKTFIGVVMPMRK